MEERIPRLGTGWKSVSRISEAISSGGWASSCIQNEWGSGRRSFLNASRAPKRNHAGWGNRHRRDGIENQQCGHWSSLPDGGALWDATGFDYKEQGDLQQAEWISHQAATWGAPQPENQADLIRSIKTKSRKWYFLFIWNWALPNKLRWLILCAKLTGLWGAQIKHYFCACFWMRLTFESVFSVK